MMIKPSSLSFRTLLLAGLLAAGSAAWAAGFGGGSSGSTGGVQPGEDTSFAIEKSYSCLSGGCHENNSRLVNEHAASLMTHAMVKCNACHGTHTRAELGLPKPNLTGYHPGIGATGYVVGKDRCLACHSAQTSQANHPKNPKACTGCHVPHVFSR
jgi:hypothetical protein